MKNFFRFYFLFSLVIVVFSCSDDNDSDEPQIRNGGDVFTSQLVTIHYNGSLQDEYAGVLGAFDVNLIKTTDNELVFVVPSNIDSGNTSLRIPGLNGLQIKYNIQSTTLLGSTDDTISEMQNRIDLFVNGLGVEDVADISTVQSSFSESFNSLTEVEREQAALFYEANKTLINEILESADFSRLANPELFRSANVSDTGLIIRFKASGVFFSAGVALAILGVEPIEKGLGVLVAVVALKKFKLYKREIDSRNLKVFSAAVDGITADFERNSNSTIIEFDDGEEKTLDFSVDRRDFISSDADEGADGVIDYIKSFDLVNIAISKLNQVITFVNDNLFFSNIELVNTLSENESTLETTVVTDEVFSGFQFSVIDSNVEINSVDFENGELKLTLGIVNPNLVNEGIVNTRLEYAYNDDFNSIAGSFDISVSGENYEELIIGTWRANSVLYNGEEIFDPACYEELVFSTNNFNSQDLGVCDEPQSTGGNYSINGNTLVVNFTEGDFIGSNSSQILELTETSLNVSEGGGYVYSYEKVDVSNYEELIIGTWRANSVLHNGEEIFNPECYEDIVYTSSNFTSQDYGACDNPQSTGGDYSINVSTLNLNFTEGDFSGNLSIPIWILTATSLVVGEDSEYVYSYQRL